MQPSSTKYSEWHSPNTDLLTSERITGRRTSPCQTWEEDLDDQLTANPLTPKSTTSRKILKKELKTTSASFMRSHIEALLSHHLRELERICIIIYLDNSQNLLSWNYIFCMDVRIIINFNTWIWIFNKLKLKVRPSISIEEPTVSFKNDLFCMDVRIIVTQSES